MRTIRIAGTVLLAAMIAACVPRAAPPAPVPPPPEPIPPPAPRPVPPPSAMDWMDAPLTPGDWSLAGSALTPSAVYGTGTGPLFQIACSRPGQIGLSVPDAQGTALTIRTTFGERTVSTPTLPAADPLFEQIAFSRGRFLVRAPGVPDRILPSWPEPARIVEDCRGQ